MFPFLPGRRTIHAAGLAAGLAVGIAVAILMPLPTDRVHAAAAVIGEPSVEELRTLVPADWRPTLRTVAPDRNAFIPIDTACHRLVVPSGDLATTLSSWALWSGTAPEKTSEMRAWLRSNSEALELFRSAARLPECRFPALPPGGSDSRLNAVLTLGRGVLAQARLNWREGNQDAAINGLDDALRVSHHASEGARSLIQLLVASAQRRQALDAIHQAALSPKVTPNELRHLAEILATPVNEAEALRQAIRAELWEYIVPGTRLATIRTNYASVRTNALLLEIYPEELHPALSFVFDPGLLATHPRPFDAVAAVRRDVAHWIEVARRADAPWTTNAAPDDTEAVKVAFLKDIEPVADALEDEEFPLSADAVSRAAPLFAKIEDPVGRLLQSLPSLGAPTAARVFEATARWQAIRGVVALRRWAGDHGGNLPDSWSVIVEAGLLPAAPIDPFSGQALRYSARRGVVWSVGRNGRDDEGKRAPEAQNGADDPVWSLKPGPGI